MAWETSNRKSRLPANWPQIRLRIGNRDNWSCQWRVGARKCGAHANQVDHIIPGDDHSDSNLQMLCEEHHKRKSSSEGGAAYWAQFNAKKKSFMRPVEKPPAPPPINGPPKYAGF